MDLILLGSVFCSDLLAYVGCGISVETKDEGLLVAMGVSPPLGIFQPLEWGVTSWAETVS